ncbi:MAG: hypothetical protein IKQ80_02955 [Clostridia bacterium]|nr:hypothetical protein [Clostridia bacterium]
MRGPAKHMVHGEWMTVAEAATRLGVKAGTLNAWRYTNRTQDDSPASVETAYGFYSAVNAGQIKRIPGRPPARRLIGGKMMSPMEVAQVAGVKRSTLYAVMCKHGMDLEQAARYYEGVRTRRAVREIMRIIYGG